MPGLLVALMLDVVPMEGEAPFLGNRKNRHTGEAVRHVSPSPETPQLGTGRRLRGVDGANGGSRVLKDSMGWRARSRAILWRLMTCSLMVFALFDTAEPHQQQR